jgi:hypothetical protein
MNSADDLQNKLLNDLLKKRQINNIIKSEMAKSNMADAVSKNEINNTSLILSEIDKNAFAPPQLEGESDEDYNARLEIWKNQQELKIQKVVIDEKSKFKKNLLKIMNETQANDIMSDPRIQDDNIIKLNKYWSSFEKALKSNFDKINLNDFKTFMDKFVDLVDKPGQLEELRNLNQKLDKEFEKIGDLMETITSDKPTLLLEAPKPESETRDKFTEAYLYKRLMNQIDKEKILKGDILVKTKINNLKKLTDEQLLEKINDEYPLLKEVYRTYRENKSDTTKTGIRMVREIADQSSGRVSHTNIDKIAKAGARYRNKKLENEPEVLRADMVLTS